MQIPFYNHMTSFLGYTLHVPKMIKFSNLLNFTWSKFGRYRTYFRQACWKCGSEGNSPADLFCGSCRTIQRPSTDNYFKLFGLEESYSVDQKMLKNTFRHMQSLLHPDKFGNKTNEEKTISEEYSSLLNKAYGDLQAPLKRAEHLLKLRGETIDESETVGDQQFLMEVMTLNEEVEDAENNVEKLKYLNEKNRKRLSDLQEVISENFFNGDITKVKKNIAKMRYFSSLNKRINDTLRELGATD